MFKMFKITTAAACLAIGLIASPAQAGFINGGITVTDTLNPALLPQASAGVASLLTAFNPRGPQPTGNTSTLGVGNDFDPATLLLATMASWTFSPCPGAGCGGLAEITVGGFTFDIQSAVNGGGVAF